MKILITGGHLAPALALIDEIKRHAGILKKDVDIIFVGRKYALDSEKTISLEYKEILKLNIPFIPIQAGRLTRIFSLKSLRNIFRIPLGFINALSIIRSSQPDSILSFGGYLALPIAFWGYIFKIPIYTHEQTINPGLANKIISKFSKKTFVAFEESKSFFNKNKVVISGNPVRFSIFKTIKKPFDIKKEHPVIYITGGSLGSHSINIHVVKILKKLLGKYIVIHQVGDTKEYQDFEKLLSFKNRLSQEYQGRYYLRKHFFEEEIGYIYKISDLVIGRSGANTFFELISLHKPALFIPLPWSSGREQQKHAEIFAKAKIGEIFHQIEPSEKLLRLINQMVSNISFYKENFKNYKNFSNKDASSIIVQSIFNKT